MAGMKELIEDIAKALVDEPEQVVVRETAGEQVTVLELRVAPGRPGQSDRQTGAYRAFDSNAAGRGRHEVESPVQPGDSGVTCRQSSGLRWLHCGAPAESAARSWRRIWGATRNGSRLA